MRRWFTDHSTTSFKFKCTAEWHFARMGSALAPLIFNYSMFLTGAAKTTAERRFYVSLGELETYFHADKKAIRRALKKLVAEGFFVKLRAIPGETTAYRPLKHSEWKVANPGKCLEKLTTTWEDEEKDPLLLRLHAASGGRLHLFANFLVGLRKTGHDDDALVAHWVAFEAQDSGTRKGLFGRFMAYVRAQPTK